ncbi:MAG: tRNA-uridine aminocarboxypropyltransferase, partial [Burkholderiaceae bacterium]|nr:tRNA-uridine aminocarboxypropyltransferase [Burkholderiaceae bacterium]
MPPSFPSLQTKRPTCTTCLRPQTSCICKWVTPIAHEVEVLILQHPMEVHQAKGSARLLHLCLPHSKLMTGEVFDEQMFESPKHSVLLYPQSPDDMAQGISKPPILAPVFLKNPVQLRLIVLDGTWRKSRKMLYLSPPLRALPRLSLQDPAASSYRIRKAHRPDQLSTLEA